MKFNTGLAIVFSISASIVMDGCKKDDDVTPSSIICYEVSESETGTLGSSTQTATYNSNNVVTSILVTIGSGSATYTPVYGSDGKITKLTISDGSFVTYTYGTNGLLSESSTTLSGTVYGKTAYSYNASSQLTLVQNYGLVNGTGPLTLSTHDVYAYADTNTKNVLTVSHFLDYQTSTLSSTDAYEYDTHKTPSTISASPGASGNNVTKITTKNASGSVTNTTTYTYTYNENDYPLTEKMSSTGNSNGLAAQSSTTTYTYNCK